MTTTAASSPAPAAGAAPPAPAPPPPKPPPKCLTCASTEGCEEDLPHNPGDYYCVPCWDAFEKKFSQEEGQEEGRERQKKGREPQEPQDRQEPQGNREPGQDREASEPPTLAPPAPGPMTTTAAALPAPEAPAEADGGAPPAPPPPKCLTCASTECCEEDCDNPGDWYCVPCWEKFGQEGEEEQEPRRDREAAASFSAATPRGLSPVTQEEEEGRKAPSPTAPPSPLKAPPETRETPRGDDGSSPLLAGRGAPASPGGGPRKEGRGDAAEAPQSPGGRTERRGGGGSDPPSDADALPLSHLPLYSPSRGTAVAGGEGGARSPEGSVGSSDSTEVTENPRKDHVVDGGGVGDEEDAAFAEGVDANDDEEDSDEGNGAGARNGADPKHDAVISDTGGGKDDGGNSDKTDDAIGNDVSAQERAGPEPDPEKGGARLESPRAVDEGTGGSPADAPEVAIAEEAKEADEDAAARREGERRGEDRDEDGDAWMCTQEDHAAESGMSGGLGLLTQAPSDYDDDDDDDDGDDDEKDESGAKDAEIKDVELEDASMEEAGEEGAGDPSPEKIADGDADADDKEEKAGAAAAANDDEAATGPREPILVEEAVVDRDKIPTLSGLTEPSQQIPRDKLPRFADAPTLTGATGQGTPESPRRSAATPSSGKPRDEVAKAAPASSDRDGIGEEEAVAPCDRSAGEGSSAFRGLTEEDEAEATEGAVVVLGGPPPRSPRKSLLTTDGHVARDETRATAAPTSCDPSGADDKEEAAPCDRSAGEGSSAYRGLTEEDRDETTDDDAEGFGNRRARSSPTLSPTNNGDAPRDEDHPMEKDELAPPDINPDCRVENEMTKMAVDGSGDGEVQRGEPLPSTTKDTGRMEKNGDDSLLGGDESVHEGTCDTLGTAGSGGGWSLYEGDTQMLPTAPSQIVAAAPSIAINVREEGEANARRGGTSTVGKLDALSENDADGRGNAAAPSSNQRNQLSNKNAGSDGGLDVTEEKASDNDDIRAPTAETATLLMSIKHTPEDGSALPISYPNDHLVSSPQASKESPPREGPSLNDTSTRRKILERGDAEGGDGETQLSQDLLAASPVGTKSSQQGISPGKPPSLQTAQTENKVTTDPQSFRPVNAGGHIGVNDGERQSAKGHDISEKSQAKSTLPLQKKATVDPKWISSARHMHNAKQNDARDNDRGSSPRLLLPSFKPILSKKSDDPDGPNADVAADVDAAAAVAAAGDGSDDDSWPPPSCGLNYEDDPIENTQDDNRERTSTFKRLSRGTSSRSSSSVRRDDSSGKFSSRSSENRSKSTGRSSSGTKSAIKPKVLQYGYTKGKDNDDNASTSSLPASESSAEAEFTIDYADDCNHFQHSQTDQRVMRQLREMEGIANNLPSAEEMQEISSRKELLDEIADLKKSHEISINKLKRENDKLRRDNDKLMAQRRNAEDSVQQKERIIKEKNALLDKQFKLLEQFKAKVQGAAIANPPPTAIRKKRKKKDDASDEDNEEDDDMPLSALKNTSSSNKKMYGSRQRKKVAKRGTTSSSEAEVEEAATSASNHSSGGDTTSSAKTPPVTNRPTAKRGKKPGKGGEGIKATKRGDLDKSCNKAPSTAGKKVDAQQPKGQRAKSPGRRYPGHSILQLSDDPSMDDSRLIGSSKLLTLESTKTAILIACKFVCDDEHFRRNFFKPLWDCLKDQGSESESNLNWRYGKTSKSLEREWCFVPPKSVLESKGKLGKDYFLSEEQVVLCVLKEVETMKQLFDDGAAEAFKTLLPVLNRAVDDNMEYSDAKSGKSASVRTRRAAKIPDLSPQPKSGKRKSPQNNGEDSSIKPKSGAKGKSPTRAKITPESKTTPKAKKQKTSDGENIASFHTSQTQGVEVLPTSYSKRSPGQVGGPLKDYSFFYSGVDKSFKIDERIQRMGGRVVHHQSLTLEKAKKKVFFLSDYTCWRKLKYIHAVTLGGPILHFKWLLELEQKFDESGKAYIFDSALFQKYRLPLGLDLSKDFYPLQRASNARQWNPPGCRDCEGSRVFEGMTIALSIDPKDKVQEKEWTLILTACGATIKTLANIHKGKGQRIDCCLFTSTSLPPHEVSRPIYVDKLMKLIDADVPLLDLAWAHQSIIQRKRLAMVDNPRFSVSLDHSTDTGASRVSSIRKKDGVRYEVGDLVQFSSGPKGNSRGRILGIIWERQGKGCKLEIQLLESKSNGGYELVDCPSSPKVSIDEGSLQGNITMLRSRNEFRRLGYLPKNPCQSNIFNRIEPTNESQM